MWIVDKSPQDYSSLYDTSPGTFRQINSSLCCKLATQFDAWLFFSQWTVNRSLVIVPCNCLQWIVAQWIVSWWTV